MEVCRRPKGVCLIFGQAPGFVMGTLEQILQELTTEGSLYQKLEDNRVRCVACGHRCMIPEGAAGVCRVRFNSGGVLKVPFGYVGGAQCDPIEKKPFFHVRPGALAFSFGMLGCDFHCAYCQNWLTSQVLRNPASVSSPRAVSPSRLVRMAHNQHAEVMVSTYNEPLITSEWAIEVFKEAKDTGLITGYVSNGNGTPEVLEALRPWLDLYKVDLKTFDDRQYRKLGGRLQPILDTIRNVHSMGLWLEIVTLLVPGFNDSEEELARMTEFIADVSCDIPWHVTAFHKDYRMTDPEDTSADDLLRAVRIGQKSGLKYIYAGNLPGMVRDYENTCCQACGKLLIERRGYRILSYALDEAGQCGFCKIPIPGRWSEKRRPQISDQPFLPSNWGY
jgi:pyruvate formate lyase activating enzyme